MLESRVFTNIILCSAFMKVHNTTVDYQEVDGIDYTKLCVMAAICIGTIFGNVAVILAIVARNIKVIY